MGKNKKLLDKYLTNVSGGKDDDTETDEGLQKPYGVVDPKTGIVIKTFATLKDAMDYIEQNDFSNDELKIWDGMRNIKIMLNEKELADDL